ncbi:hypothetical protein THAOC_26714, partial [Thalassiosira oceanica]
MTPVEGREDTAAETSTCGGLDRGSNTVVLRAIYCGERNTTVCTVDLGSVSNLERANSQPTAAHGTVEVDGANCLSRTFITFIKIAISGESVHGELPPAIISSMGTILSSSNEMVTRAPQEDSLFIAEAKSLHGRKRKPLPRYGSSDESMGRTGLPGKQHKDKESSSSSSTSSSKRARTKPPQLKPGGPRMATASVITSSSRPTRKSAVAARSTIRRSISSGGVDHGKEEDATLSFDQKCKLIKSPVRRKRTGNSEKKVEKKAGFVDIYLMGIDGDERSSENHYDEETAWRYHNPPFPHDSVEQLTSIRSAFAQQLAPSTTSDDLKPIPPPHDLPSFPDTGLCTWSFDEDSRVLLADFRDLSHQKGGHTEKPHMEDEMFLFRMMERDDIT